MYNSSLFSGEDSKQLTNNLRWEPVSNTTNTDTVALAGERQDEVEYYANLDQVESLQNKNLGWSSK